LLATPAIDQNDTLRFEVGLETLNEWILDHAVNTSAVHGFTNSPKWSPMKLNLHDVR
jgi:hypothetical protein